MQGTAAFIASCQTYEGGFASASQPYFSQSSTLLSAPRPPLGEAHGGYTFCAVASWVLLLPFTERTGTTGDLGKDTKLQNDPDTDAEAEMKERPQINLKTLLRWLVQVQGTEAELGGFKGRTNKLVDGCYSWWCGGAITLLEALGVGGSENAVRGAGFIKADKNGDWDEDEVKDETWDDVDGLHLSSSFPVYPLPSSLHRFPIQSSSFTRIHFIRRTTPRRWPAR